MHHASFTLLQLQSTSCEVLDLFLVKAHYFGIPHLLTERSPVPTNTEHQARVYEVLCK